MEAELNAWMQSWWAGHPEATLTELETELDQQVAALRAQVLQATLAQGEEQVRGAECGDRRMSGVWGKAGEERAA